MATDKVDASQHLLGMEKAVYCVYRHTANGKHSSRSNSVAGASAALFTIHLMLTNTH